MSYSGPLSIAIGVEKNPSTVIPMTETDDESHRDMWKPSLVFSKQTAHFHVVFSILSGSDHETLVHLPLNAELFCEDDGTGGAETHDQVKDIAFLGVQGQVCHSQQQTQHSVSKANVSVA